MDGQEQNPAGRNEMVTRSEKQRTPTCMNTQIVTKFLGSSVLRYLSNDLLNLLLEGRKMLLDGFPDDGLINPEVIVDQNIPNAQQSAAKAQTGIAA